MSLVKNKLPDGCTLLHQAYALFPELEEVQQQMNDSDTVTVMCTNYPSNVCHTKNKQQ